MERYICIHGHFYQPPRENPWLESIEAQDSAYPYHDWNERITSESYGPNTASRILYGHDKIVRIVNNYAKISFNVGPTLLSWMESNAPVVYQAILEADRESQELFSGHGSAIAQAYGHIILPLANRRDKYTQVLWGIRDFEHRFKRTPEGMWLPETAVDLETLDVLAESGIKFTILAPYQGKRVRPVRGGRWHDVSGGKINPKTPYLVNLPSGRTMTLFFYDGPISQSIAFEGILSSGEGFAQRLIGAFDEGQESAQLVHIATDGETYGHHHRHGDMALAYAIHHIESNNLARITNYGEYLEKHPPTHCVEIFENTAWSCAHGIERWRSDCGDNSGGHPGWNQSWRAPLREALDWLRDEIAPKYEEKAADFLKAPWAARDDYAEVMLNRSNLGAFLEKHSIRPLNHVETVIVLKLLELQRHASLMYASCGWFFDELSGIETVQVIQYAGRAVQLAQEIFGDSIEPRFLELLGKAKSNIPEHGDGRRIYEKWVKPAVVDLMMVTAHYAISSLFEDYGEDEYVNCYTMHREDYQTYDSGRARLAIGRVKVTSEITTESDTLSFGVLYFGDHTINAGVRRYEGASLYQNMAFELREAFEMADFLEIIRILDRHFGTSTYSIRSLFRDEQRRVLDYVLGSVLSEAEAMYRQVYENNYSLMRFLTELNKPLPEALHSAAELVLNTNMRKAFNKDTLATEPGAVTSLVEDAKFWNIHLDAEGLGYLLKQTLEEMMSEFVSSPEDISILNGLINAESVTHSVPFDVDLWRVQNLYYDMLQTTYPKFLESAQQGNAEAQDWVKQFASLGEHLSIQVSVDDRA